MNIWCERDIAGIRTCNLLEPRPTASLDPSGFSIFPSDFPLDGLGVYGEANSREQELKETKFTESSKSNGLFL